MPTGGVDATEENIRTWIEAGACCVGMGSKLITKAAVSAGDYATISENVRQVLAWIAESKEVVCVCRLTISNFAL